MLKRRTDLALEAAQLWQESAGEAGTLPGVESEEATREGYPVTTVRIRDEAGARALGKPVGTYVTLELDGLARREEDAFGRAARALAAELGLRRTPRLLRTGEADAPLVVGLGRPVLLLPGRPLPADEREVVLLHELTHLRRHDLAHKALLFVPCAVHWFNPLVWWMAREAGRTLELCCDARVVRGRDEAFRRRYGTALLHLAAGGRGPVLSTRFGGGGRLLRARLANLFQHRRRGAAAAGLVLAAALAVTSLAACEQRLLTAEEAMDALEESIEVVIAGYQKKNSILTDKEKCIVAYHEIGHALVAAKQSNSAPVQKITIIPRTSGALGYTMQVDEGNHYLMSKEELENKIATLTGGRAAEEVVFRSITTGASNDIEQATKLARAMLTRYGMSKDFDMVALETVNNQYLGGDTSLACSAQTQREIDQKVVELVRAQHEKAVRILTDNRAKLDELAQYLYQKETITGEEFMEILNREPAQAQ